MKKIVTKNKNKLYILKDVEACYCDFCGEQDIVVFESEWRHPQNGAKSDMQICYSCVKQLYKLIPKK